MSDGLTAARALEDPGARAEALIRHYFDMCNAADRDGLIACFSADGAHYFPPGLRGVPWRTAEAIADGWVWCVGRLGSQWTLETILAAPDGRRAVSEWTHYTTTTGEVLRGTEWYEFDDAVSVIHEIRAYYASPINHGQAHNALVGFDYAGRGYHTAPTTSPPPSARVGAAADRAEQP
ncbi:nuclear transport factor 2 family protein [Acuticoccus sp.]|uniref:nuclear transport factor 2 family protein n=1 Tax=Acuticoccus sp. TaxID=1904378 RepID=UPI003B525B6A